MLLFLVLMFGICLYFYKQYDDDYHDGIKTLINICLYVSAIMFLFFIAAIAIGCLVGASYINSLI